MAHRKDPLDLLLDAIFDQIFDAEWTGRHGEKLTAGKLKRLAFFMGDGKVLRNAYVPKEGGGTSEIDVLFITSRGVFVIESKNYSGWIFGNEADRMWTARLQSGQSNRFYNPIRQNRGHIKWLGRYVGEDVPLYSLVVFSERCELKKITVASEDVAVIKRDDLGQTVRRMWKAAEGAGPVDVEGVYRQLEPLTHADAKTRAEHVEEARAAAMRDTRRPGWSEQDQHRAGGGTAGAARKSDSGSDGAVERGADATAPAEGATPIATQGEQWPHRAPVPESGAARARAEETAVASAAIAPGAEATLAAKAEPAPGVEPAAQAAPATMAAPAAEAAPAPPLCPRCGKPLVVRTARRGANAGKQFYGCSGYPSCRYTRSL